LILTNWSFDLKIFFADPKLTKCTFSIFEFRTKHQKGE
jgi:hypothetical protein